MSVNIIIKSGKILVNFNEDFSAISDLRLVDNCLKMTAYDVILVAIICIRNSNLRCLK